MGSEIWAIVFGLAGILLLAVLMIPVASRTRIPHTVILAVLGIALGFLIHYLGGAPEAAGSGGYSGGHGAAAADSGHGSEPFWMQMLKAIGSLEITADVILFIFLPALVFESALSLNVRKLMADIGPILFLAAIGVLISTFVIGQAISWHTGQALLLCLLLGAVVSATDPVAVISLFKDLGAPKRLTILVEGESLFNDATAIVVSTILLSILVEPGGSSWFGGLLQFFVVFFGGIVVGLVLTWLAQQIVKPFKRQPIVIVTITVILPFILFVVAEHFMHISGVMACVAGGLLLGSVGRRIIPPQIFSEIEHTWHQIAFWATSLIFVLVGLAVPSLLGGDALSYWDEVLFLFAVATVIRALIIFGLVPLLSRAGLAQQVSGAFRTIMVWGGLRGAVSLALALIILESPGVSPEDKTFIGVMVTSFVLLTLLGQATTISPLLALLGLNKLDPTDQAVRDRSLIKALSDVKGQIEDLIQNGSSVGPEKLVSVTDVYQEALEKAEATADGNGLTDTDWQLIGLEMALSQERQMYLQKFGEGLVGSGRLRETLSSLEEVSESLSDVTRSNSHQAADIAIQQGVSYAPNFMFAMMLQRRLGLTGPLASSLEKRFGILALKRDVLREQRQSRLPEITGLLPREAQSGFVEIMDRRIELVEEHHKALCLQYPEYAEALEKSNLEQIGLRLEEMAYNRLQSNSIIGPEIHSDLMRELASRQASASRLPHLKLDQDPAHLIAKVPFFVELPVGKQRQIARMLKTRFTVPGENVISAGEVGDKMYFIASGAFRIHVKDQDLTLGTGDFFGELALITSQPRNADVSALGFSTLLELHKRDFNSLLKKDSSIRKHIRAVAIERLGPDFNFDLD